MARVLVEMRIRGLGVIDDATLELGPGLTVVTGETGAGKTMVVSGLTLLLGGRGDAGLVRAGVRQAVVEGRLALPAESPAVRRALEAGAELDDDGTLLVSRIVGADGRSRAHVGGRAVPVGLLGELADDLVTVHGQSDQLRLLRPARQRDALDRYAGEPVARLLARHRELHAQWQAADDDLRDRTERARERAQEEALLRHGLAEIDAAEAQPGEDTALAAEAERLSHVDALRLAALGAHSALAGDLDGGDHGNVSALLGNARRSLDGATAHDEALSALARRVDELGYLAADVAGDLASYAERLDADPERLAQVQERRAVLTGLVRRYGDTVDAVLAWAAQARDRLDELDSSADTLAALAERRDGLARQLAVVTGELTAARAAAAARFGRSVTAELTGLAMPHAAVEVALSPRPEVGPDGADEVELLLRPHRGAPARPLQRGASGGELSRVMLAVEVVFAGADRVPTRVFDEVDAGVGGRAAVEVGRRLARLATGHQVLVVTHLPQVAAFADRHLAVRKDEDGTVGRSGVARLEGSDRVRELSRMLAGLDDSDLAAGHAEELLAAAAAARAPAAPTPAAPTPAAPTPAAATPAAPTPAAATPAAPTPAAATPAGGRRRSRRASA